MIFDCDCVVLAMWSILDAVNVRILVFFVGVVYTAPDFGIGT